MLTEYIKAAMRKAKYEILEDDGSFYGEIPECQGVWANTATLEACRDELQEVLEGWIVLGLLHNDPMPIIDGLELAFREVTKEELEAEASAEKLEVA